MGVWTSLFLVVCAAVLPAHYAASGVRPKIAGPGRMYVAPNQFPWLVFILNKNTQEYITAGILIKPSVVLTIGYNYLDGSNSPETIHVVLGAHNRSIEEAGTQTIDVTKILIYPTMNQTYEGDVSLMQLATPATLSPKIKIFPIREINGDPSLDNKLPKRGDCVCIGWGRIRNTLFEIILPKTPQMYKPEMQTFKTCLKLGRELDFYANPEAWLCSFNADTTQIVAADGGNPLICSVRGGELRLHGLTSWSNPYERTGLSGFTRLSSYRPWINKNAKMLDAEMDA